jgi:hypothetical protein
LACIATPRHRGTRTDGHGACRCTTRPENSLPLAALLPTTTTQQCHAAEHKFSSHPQSCEALYSVRASPAHACPRRHLGRAHGRHPNLRRRHLPQRGGRAGVGALGGKREAAREFETAHHASIRRGMGVASGARSPETNGTDLSGKSDSTTIMRCFIILQRARQAAAVSRASEAGKRGR